MLKPQPPPPDIYKYPINPVGPEGVPMLESHLQSVSTQNIKQPPLQMGEVEQQPSPTGLLGWVGFGCSIFALACMCVSFASPYWMQTYPLSFNTFQNMGLWEICMKDYMHHKDDSQTIYNGCWWVFDREEKFEKLKEWLLPPWFITCQVMVTMNLICQFATIAIIAMIFLHFCPIINHEYHQSYAMFAASGLCFFITILTVIVGIMYGVFCGDRQWMPRPDLNFISWGYGFLIIQGIITTGAGVCYFLEAQKAFNELDRRDQEYTKAVLDMEMSQACPTNLSYGAPSYGHQSYDQGSNYDNSMQEKQSYASQPSFDPSRQSLHSQHSDYYNEKPAYPPGQQYPAPGQPYSTSSQQYPAYT